MSTSWIAFEDRGGFRARPIGGEERGGEIRIEQGEGAVLVHEREAAHEAGAGFLAVERFARASSRPRQLVQCSAIGRQRFTKAR